MNFGQLSSGHISDSDREFVPVKVKSGFRHQLEETISLKFVRLESSSLLNVANGVNGLFSVVSGRRTEVGWFSDLGHVGGDHHWRDTLDGDTIFAVFLVQNLGELNDVLLGGTVDPPVGRVGETDGRRKVNNNSGSAGFHLFQDAIAKHGNWESVDVEDITMTFSSTIHLSEFIREVMRETDIVDENANFELIQLGQQFGFIIGEVHIGEVKGDGFDLSSRILLNLLSDGFEFGWISGDKANVESSAAQFHSITFADSISGSSDYRPLSAGHFLQILWSGHGEDVDDGVEELEQFQEKNGQSTVTKSSNKERSGHFREQL